MEARLRSTQSVVRLLFVYQNLYQLEAIAGVVAAKRRSKTFVNECTLFGKPGSRKENWAIQYNNFVSF